VTHTAKSITKLAGMTHAIGLNSHCQSVLGLLFKAMEDNDDVVHVAIPQEHILHLFSHYLNLSTLEPFSSNMHWACISQALQQAASEITSPPDQPLYRSASPSSAGSSPTLMPSSSRAGSSLS
jgi:hypothetical protein